MIRKALRFPCSALLALAAVLPLSAEAATVRSSVAVRGAQVHLSDLFSGLESGQDCDIGPAPAPGQTEVISGPQLEAIASQFGVDWPDASDVARVTLTRASRSVSEDDLLPLITDALQKKGIPDDASVTLGNFSAPMVAADGTAPVRLTSVTYDPAHGRFSAYFTTEAAGGQGAPFRADGVVSRQVDVLVTTRDLAAGEMITPHDVEASRREIHTVSSRIIAVPGDAAGNALRRGAPAGTVLTSDMLMRVSLVEKGAPVILDVTSSGIHLTASGVALESGAMGQRIHVLNPASKMIVAGQVSDRSRVSVLPGTTPTPADQRALRLAGAGARPNI